MTAYGLRRGFFTLAGLAGAAALVWTAQLFDRQTTGGYWAAMAVLAGAGLAIILSQLIGGWTKDGMPRFSAPVFLVAFLPALVVFGWVLVAGQPGGNTTRDHVLAWSKDLHVNGLVNDLRQFLPAIAFLLGLAFGLVLDTTGRRAERRAVADGTFEPAVADTPITRERIATGTTAGETPVAVDRGVAATQVVEPRGTLTEKRDPAVPI
jgi:hypothetical protein